MKNYKIIEGDLLEAKKGVICHQVNCLGAMNSGVALAIRKKYPKVYNLYYDLVTHMTEEKFALLGYAQIIEIDSDLMVANLFSQYDFGYSGQRYTEYGSFRFALINLIENIELYRNPNEMFDVHFPYKIGSDRGGAYWPTIEDIIKSVFSKYNDYNVIVHKLNS